MMRDRPSAYSAPMPATAEEHCAGDARTPDVESRRRQDAPGGHRPDRRIEVSSQPTRSLLAVGYVFAFDHKHRKPPMSLKDLLGGKGANLAEMTSVLGLPVPPGFTISTDACREYMHEGWPKGLDDEIAKQRAKLEKTMGKKLGDPA